MNLEADQTTYAYFKPRLNTWEEIIENMMCNMYSMQQEMACRRAQSAQTLARTREVLSHWESVGYSEVRLDILEVLDLALCSIEEDGLIILMNGRGGIKLLKSLQQGTRKLHNRTEELGRLTGAVDSKEILQAALHLQSVLHFLLCGCILAVYLVEFVAFEKGVEPLWLYEL